jgi:hypothetical protein
MAISKDFIFSNFSPFLNFFQNEKEIGEGCMCGAVRGLACFFFLPWTVPGRPLPLAHQIFGTPVVFGNHWRRYMVVCRR